MTTRQDALLDRLIENAEAVGRYDGMYKGGLMSEADHRMLTLARQNVRECRVALLQPKAAPETSWPDVDEFAQHIRWLNGGNKTGAAALAEKLLEWLQSRVATEEQG